MSDKLRRYELVYIVQPEATDEERAKVEERVSSICERMHAHVLKKEDWGKRKLAYEIKKSNKGYYSYLVFAAPATVPAEIERNLRLLDSVLRYLTICLDKDISLEAAKAEIAAEEEARAAARARMAQMPKDDDDDDALTDDDPALVEEEDDA
jgi:small subunit ribosomal protein S6